MKHKRRLGIAAGAILASVVLLYVLLYMYERPGGWSDQRMSQALKLDQSIQIPLGTSPEDAVRLFRNFSYIQVLHQESAARGMLVFYTRADQKDGSDLQVEYVRKTWLGWKWVWGGGYGNGGASADSAMNYMSLPEVDHISTPFPIVFGEVLDPSIQKVAVETKDAGPEQYEAKIIQGANGTTLWFVFLPAPARTPFEIEGLNEAGERVTAITVTDVRDSGPVPLGD
jgi:hypothetical protein